MRHAEKLAAALDALMAERGVPEVMPEAVRDAATFLESLPIGFPMPHIGIDPDGAISFDWSASRAYAFSVSADGSGRLAFAWIRGAHTGSGVRVVPPMGSRVRQIAVDDRR